MPDHYDENMTSIQPYTGVTVLDFTYELGSYATRLFADLGATVIRIEPVGGALDRKAIEAMPGQAARLSAKYTFMFRNASKTAFTFNPNDPGSEKAVDSYLQSAQLIFLERDGLFAEDIDRIRNLKPLAIITYLSPYGLTGSSAHLKANDLSLQAAGGIAWMSGRPDEAPLRLPVDQSAMITSVYAAVAAAAALFDTERTGHGHLVDVSAQECIAHSLQNALQVYDLEGVVSSRNGEGTRDATEGIFSCEDGYMLLASPLALGPSWGSLVAWIKEEQHPAFEILVNPRWLNAQWRKTLEAKQAFRDAFSGFIGEYSKKEILEQALKRKIVMSPISSMSEVLADEQLAYRRYFKSLECDDTERGLTFPGAPYQFSEPIWDISMPPPLTSH